MLRAVEEWDNGLLLEMMNDGEIEQKVGGWSFPLSMGQQRKWFESLGSRDDLLRCMIEVSGEAVGTAILSGIDMKNGTAEVHIKIGKRESRGQGIGAEAVNSLVAYGFGELRLNCIYAIVLEDNVASRKLFARCGFEEEGILKGRLFKDGRYKNVVSYSKRKE